MKVLFTTQAGRRRSPTRIATVTQADSESEPERPLTRSTLPCLPRSCCLSSPDAVAWPLTPKRGSWESRSFVAPPPPPPSQAGLRLRGSESGPRQASPALSSDSEPCAGSGPADSCRPKLPVPAPTTWRRPESVGIFIFMFIIQHNDEFGGKLCKSSLSSKGR